MTRVRISKHNRSPIAFPSRFSHALRRVACAVLFGAAFIAQSALAHTPEQSAEDYNRMKAYFDGLDPTRGMPKGMTRQYIENKVKTAGGSQADVEFILSTFNSDVCGFAEMRSLCAYMGKETLYKVSNLAWKAKSAGASDQEVRDLVAPVMEFGTSRNLEALYGEGGLSDSDFAKLGVDAKSPDQSNNPLQSERFASRLLCLGLPTDVDEQVITSTNPVYGRHYRLITCSFGFNWRWSIRFFWWDLSVQAGLVGTNSRFSRRVLGIWHLTGAEQICAQANALGNIQTLCNTNNWVSPVALRASVLFMQPPGVVVARGWANKLGHYFSNARWF